MTMPTQSIAAIAILAVASSLGACSKSTSGICAYGGRTYQVGASFRSTDGCNTCQCQSRGVVACTLVECLGDASIPERDGSRVGDVGADLAIAADSAITKSDSPGVERDTADSRDGSVDRALTLDSSADSVPVADSAADSKTLSDTGKDATVACPWGDASLPPGQSVFDGCNICACSEAGMMMCTDRACPPVDAATLRDGMPASDATPTCNLPAALTFGSDGGLVMYRDVNALDVSGNLTVTRTYYRTAGDGAMIHACAPPLPACGTAGVVTVATVAADLAAPEVKAAFQPGATPIYGVDMRATDGTVYSITVAGTGTILVGWPCPAASTTACVEIPGRLARLVSDLQSLATSAVASSACSGL